ncbi:MAG: putative metal-binding motif-containing protein, partial [Myxococcota bacterium]
VNVNPDAKDICNLKNDDCDFFVDEDEPPIKVWHDRDEDGFGDDTMPAFSVCVVGTQQVTNDDDCDDTDANVNPDAKDICNLKNDDCDFFVDEDEPPTKVWHDRDEDGFGDRTKPAFSVCVPGSTQVTNDDDCDDTDANVNPDAKDVCNFIDDDCDAFIDEDEAPTKVWKDSDGDGFGCAGSAAVKVCAVSSGYVDNDQDCDDTDKDVNPDAVDICNFADDDCDRFIDEDESPYAVYKDGDSDGYGDRLDIGMKVCADTSGYVRDRTDCDDTRTGVYPGADELCGTSIDEDCDGSIDESDAIDALTWYYDGDLDGFGTADTTTLACDPPFRYADNADDCDDTDYMVSPAAFEICDNEIDDDCNELVDAADSEVCALSYCGVIETDTVWAAGEIIPVTCTVSVEDGATLTVEDGAVVEFSSGASLVIGVIDTSALVIEGDTDGVTFTSDQSTPASGDWGGVIVGANDLGSELDGLTIEYGGETGTECLLIDSVDLALTDVTVQLCGGDQGVRAALSSLTLNDLSVLDNDGDGLTLEENTTLTDGATLTASGNGGYPAVLTLETLGAFSTDSELTGNHDDRLKVPAGTLRESVSWSDPGIPFLFTGEVYVDAFGPATAVTLSIGAGVEAHFDTDAGLFIGYGGTGALTVAGTSTNPVIFTSAQDSPEAGDWLGIEFGVWDDGSTLEEVEISYGGGNTYGNLFFDGGSAASVSSATITNSSAYGIYRTSGVTPSLSTISYADNVSGDLF